MRTSWVPLLLLELLVGCASTAPTKPVEYLDDQTAMTVGSLKEPIELMPSTVTRGAHLFAKHPSFAYLGPIEWDRSGNLVYGLWVHIAPGNDRPIADIRSDAAVTLVLDSGSQVLSPIDAPQLGKSAYQPVASWGQTAYFELTVAMLKQMAASEKFELNVRNANDSIVSFVPTGDTRETLTNYLTARGISSD
jgi:hypothetical protein